MVATLPKHSIKPGRTSPALALDSAITGESFIGCTNNFSVNSQNPQAGCLDVVKNS